MVSATVMSDATIANPGDHTPRGKSVYGRPTDASFRLWDRDHSKVDYP